MSNLLESLNLTSWPSVLTIVGVSGAVLWALFNRRFLYAVVKTFPRDMRALYRLIRITLDLKFYQRHDHAISDAFDVIARKCPEKVLIYFEDQKWTAEMIEKFSNRIANYFQMQGIKKGDTIAIFMENNAEYMAIWLGLSRLGCVSSLVNYNLRLQPLKHCFEAVNCKGIIYSPGLKQALDELVDLGDFKTPLYCVGHEGSEPLSKSVTDLTQELRNVSDKKPVVSDKPGFLSALFYIYTSGTTGLPKAAIIKNSRYFMATIGNFYMHGLNVNDIVYTSLPLYHGSGVMLGGGTMLCYGLSQVIRKKFSASGFWKDCIRYQCTAAQYIGEICRYLLAQPESSIDKTHKVRVMFGNGLKAEIWPDFVNRFNIPHISELYGATEGNCNMVNIDDEVGSCGFLPIHLKWIIPYKLIKVDEATGQPIRDEKTGFVIPCEYNEPGELIGRIQRNHPIRDYDGYADKNSSKDKILNSAFRKGDAYFRSGDILVQNEFGYFFFKDRKGDTFRWKGENCSTTEVESVISTVCGHNDAAVYGVSIPGAEGRAGMAVISDPDDNLDMEQLAQGISKALPAYARPLFIRVSPKIEMTGTYKLKKMDYQKQGFDINQIQDKVYFLSGSKYIPVDQELYNNIMNGKVRV